MLLCAATLGLTARAGPTTTRWSAAGRSPPGRPSITFTVNVRGDRRREADERFALLVAGVPGLRLADPLAIGTILNDD